MRTNKKIENLGKEVYRLWFKASKLPHYGVKKLPKDVVELLTSKQFEEIVRDKFAYSLILAYFSAKISRYFKASGRKHAI